MMESRSASNLSEVGIVTPSNELAASTTVATYAAAANTEARGSHCARTSDVISILQSYDKPTLGDIGMALVAWSWQHWSHLLLEVTNRSSQTRTAENERLEGGTTRKKPSVRISAKPASTFSQSAWRRACHVVVVTLRPFTSAERMALLLPRTTPWRSWRRLSRPAHARALRWLGRRNHCRP